MNKFYKEGLIPVLLTVFFFSCTNGGAKKQAEAPAADSTTHTTIGKPIPEELQKLNEQVKTVTTNPTAYNERAKYYIREKELDLAYEDIVRGFSIDSTFMPLFNTVCDYHMYKGEPAQAKAALEKALTINPKSYMTHVKLGELYFLAKKYDMAFKSINEGLKINKFYADGYFWKGMIYRERADTVRAMSNFQTAVEQDPDNFKAYMQMGLLSLPSLKKETADYFSSAIRVQPANLEAYYGRAYYYQLTKDYDKSIQDYTKMTELDPTYAIAYYNLGVLQYELRVIDVAFENFDKAIRYNNRYAEAYYMRGLCHEAKSRDDEALLDFEFALSLRPNYSLAKNGIERVRNTIKKQPR